jgi:hypothetical protein
MGDRVVPVEPASAKVTSVGGVTARSTDGHLEISTKRAGLRLPLFIRLTGAIVYIGFLAHWTAVLKFTSPLLIAAFVAFWLIGAYWPALAIGEILSRWRILVENDHLTVEAENLWAIRRSTAAFRDVQIQGLDHYRGRGLAIAPAYYLSIKMEEDPMELLTGFSRRELEFVCDLLRDRVERNGALSG